jgi:O-antigen/teichoic acid export membrane protein
LVPLYTNVFSPSEYGIVTELYAYVSFLTVFLTYGMETALFRFSELHENKEKVFSTALISIFSTTALFFAIVFFFKNSIAEFLQYQAHSEYILWFALIISLDALMAIPFAKLRQSNRPKTFAALKSINIFLNIFFNLLFIVFCPSVCQNNTHPLFNLVNTIYMPEIGVGYIFISNLLASFFTMLIMLPALLKVKYELDQLILKKMLIYALPLLLAGLAGMVNETMDRILLKYLLPSSSNVMAQIGIYGACYKVSIVMTIFIQTFRYAAEPFFFSESRKGDSTNIYNKVMTYFVIACCFIFLITLLYMDFIQYFVGEKFREGLHIVPILLLANMCLGVFYNLSIWYKLSGKTQFGAFLTLFGAAITLIANYLLIPKIGYLGAAWATLLCYASIMVFSYYLGKKYYFVRYDIKRIIGYWGLAIFIYLLSNYSNHLTITSRVVINSLLLIAFAVTVYWFELKNSFSKSNT